MIRWEELIKCMVYSPNWFIVCFVDLLYYGASN